MKCQAILDISSFLYYNVVSNYEVVGDNMERYNIAGYCRISVDEEMDRENTSIENQKAIIEDFVQHKFPDSTLVFYEDRDRSGYTIEQREGFLKN